MKKQIIAILSAMIIIAFGIALAVNAADATVSLKPDKTEANPGDTFTITVSGSCEDGINGLTGNLSYDVNKLELVSAKAADENWSSLGQNSTGSVEMALIGNSTDTVKNADIFKVTFKIKDSVERGTTVKVEASNLVLDSDAAQDSEHNIGTKDVTVTIKEKVADPENTTPENTTNTATENKTEYKNIVEKNKTQSQAQTMPYTGTNMFVTMLIFAVGTLVIVSYVSYKRYKDI